VRKPDAFCCEHQDGWKGGPTITVSNHSWSRIAHDLSPRKVPASTPSPMSFALVAMIGLDGITTKHPTSRRSTKKVSVYPHLFF